jgi:PhzF family phenazine biosynthesis protein
VVLDAAGLDDARMLSIAEDVGYSETAFLTPVGERAFEVRYFSPRAEVAFCGHATIAAAVAWAERHGVGPLEFGTRNGPVPVATAEAGLYVSATLTSVAPRVGELANDDLAELLTCLHWLPGDLDPALPPRVGWAGVSHPILAAASAERLAFLEYDFDRLAKLMAARDWTTVALVHRQGEVFQARNPFPPGGVVEDPATGAAAAALGGYLRELRLVDPPSRITVLQGQHMGRPGVLTVDIPPSGGIAVTGTAVPIGSC